MQFGLEIAMWAYANFPPDENKGGKPALTQAIALLVMSDGDPETADQLERMVYQAGEETSVWVSQLVYEIVAAYDRAMLEE